MRILKTVVQVVVAVTALLFGGVSAGAQTREQLLKAAGMPVDPQVPILWHRYYDADALELLLRRIAKAYPRLTKLESIGKSHQGRDIWCLTVTDLSTGNASQKPALYVQGNLHGNELQGAEFTLYMAWYLTESHFDTPVIQRILAEKVFYLCPTVNPDGRQNFIHQGNSAESSRWAVKAIQDFNRNPRVLTGGLNDFDGDGHITEFRRRSALGVYEARPKNAVAEGMATFDVMQQLSRDSVERVAGVLRARRPSSGNYDVIAEGGELTDRDARRFDSTHEGRWPFHAKYDLNRNWGWSRSPSAMAEAGSEMWFTHAETRAVRDFFLTHPNISAAISFHNVGSGELHPAVGWRAGEDSVFRDSPEDIALYDSIAKHYERLVPGYAYRRRFDWGPGSDEEVDWMFGARGVYAFLIELMDKSLFYRRDSSEVSWGELLEADRDFLFNDAHVKWKAIDHPALGKVEVGGAKKTVWRLHPGFLMQEDAHRQLAFAVYLAFQLPKVVIREFKTRDLGNGRREVTATIANTGLLPTHSGWDTRQSVSDPVLLRLDGGRRIVSAYRVGDRSEALVPRQAGAKDARLFELASVAGRTIVRVRFVVSGQGPYRLTVDAKRGGVAEAVSRDN